MAENKIKNPKLSGYIQRFLAYVCGKRTLYPRNRRNRDSGNYCLVIDYEKIYGRAKCSSQHNYGGNVAVRSRSGKRSVCLPCQESMVSFG